MWACFHPYLINHSWSQSAAEPSAGVVGLIWHLRREVSIWCVCVCMCGYTCLCVCWLHLRVYVSVYLWEDQNSVPLLFQFPQHLLQQHQFPGGLREGRALVSPVWCFLGFLQTHTKHATSWIIAHSMWVSPAWRENNYFTCCTYDKLVK